MGPHERGAESRYAGRARVHGERGNLVEGEVGQTCSATRNPTQGLTRGGPGENRTPVSAMRMPCSTTEPQAHRY